MLENSPRRREPARRTSRRAAPGCQPGKNAADVGGGRGPRGSRESGRAPALAADGDGRRSLAPAPAANRADRPWLSADMFCHLRGRSRRAARSPPATPPPRSPACGRPGGRPRRSRRPRREGCGGDGGEPEAARRPGLAARPAARGIGRAKPTMGGLWTTALRGRRRVASARLLVAAPLREAGEALGGGETGKVGMRGRGGERRGRASDHANRFPKMRSHACPPGHGRRPAASASNRRRPARRVCPRPKARAGGRPLPSRRRLSRFVVPMLNMSCCTVQVGFNAARRRTRCVGWRFPTGLWACLALLPARVYSLRPAQRRSQRHRGALRFRPRIDVAPAERAQRSCRSIACRCREWARAGERRAGGTWSLSSAVSHRRA